MRILIPDNQSITVAAIHESALQSARDTAHLF